MTLHHTSWLATLATTLALGSAGLAHAQGSGPHSGTSSAPEVCPAVVYGPATAAPAPLRAQGRYFKDADGRVVLLRGVNATGDAKVPPFRGITDPTMLDALPQWGLNVVRLLFTWEAFEPERCQYDEAYLAYYEQVVRWAAERGVYVIVDFHQDAYSRYVNDGCGEGFPAWAVPSNLKLDVPVNDDSCKGWATRALLSTKNHAAWRAFHADKEGALTRYTEMARAVAERMGKHPNVIGYDIMNEPWGSHTELLAMYNKVGSALRERHPSSILFFSPNAIVSLGYFSDIIDIPPFENAAYSPHYYDTTVMGLRNWLGFDPGRPLGRMLHKANSRQSPMLLGEFGSPIDSRRGADYLEAIYGWLDEAFVSGAQWSYTPQWSADKKDGWNAEDFSIIANGQMRPALFKPRPYPQKTAGEPILFKRTATGLSYQWRHDPALGATELYLPEDYTVGKTITVSPSSITCSAHTLGLRCQGQPQGPKQTVTLRISGPVTKPSGAS